jgi:uncharacterized lipoprotein NlpE involved in copper resistance
MKKLALGLVLLNIIFVSCKQQAETTTTEKDTIFLDGRASDTTAVDSTTADTTTIDSVTNK